MCTQGGPGTGLVATAISTAGSGVSLTAPRKAGGSWGLGPFGAGGLQRWGWVSSSPGPTGIDTFGSSFFPHSLGPESGGGLGQMWEGLRPP